MALKLDIRKFYDSVDWNYLENVLWAHGFYEKWIHLLMQCVSTVSDIVAANGAYTPFFVPQWGLQQRDLLSPLYLFIADLSSCLLMAATTGNKITSYKIWRRSPIINHLLFANDSLVFYRATLKEVSHLQTIL